ncbi:MAG: sigma-54 dependent transcriptional regulator [Archangium sp.]|nr:sigma-54 dependent transcriptional regulator [Archangium sp.]
MAARVLFVDDEREVCEWAAEGLGRRGLATQWRTSATEALQLLETGGFDVVVADLNMPGLNGLEFCERIVANRPEVPVIVITAFGSLDTAVAAIRAGAYDFLSKPLELEALVIALERAVQTRRLRDEVKHLRRAGDEADEAGGLLGESSAMQAVRLMLGRVAAADATVLITGETGTGKEVAARLIHERSARKLGPFMAISCAALPEALMEAELFGHAKGAFTDAKTSRPGLFHQATGGTLFLDEIGDLPPGLQPRLLRALEQRAARPLGSNTEVPFDVRLIAATNRDLETAIAEGHFREELYYRINVIHLELPPLRARGGDMVLLAQRFLEEFAARSKKPVKGMSAAVAERLSAYEWPGNVRELRNCLERAVALTQDEELTVEDLPERVRAYRSSHLLVAGQDPRELVTLEEVERRYIARVLQSVQGNKTLAARILGLDRATLYRKLGRASSNGG